MVQAVAGFVKEGDDFIVGKARFFAAHGRGEIAHQISHRRLHLADFITLGKAAAAAVIVHPGAAALALARIEIQIHAADDAAAFFQLEIAHIRVPHRHAFFHQVHTIKAMNLRKQAAEHFIHRKIFFHFGFAEGIFGLTQLFAGIGHIPSLQISQAQRVAGKSLQFSQIFFGKRLGAAGQIVQKSQHLLGRIGHFGGQRQFGKIAVAQQLRLAQSHFQAAVDVGGVVEFALIAQFTGAGHISVIKLFAQFALIGILHHGDIVRHLQADFIAAFALGRGGSGKHRQRLFGKAGQFVRIIKIKRKRIGGIEHIL